MLLKYPRIYSIDFDSKLVNENSCQVYEIIKGDKYTGKFGLEKWSSNDWWQCEWMWDDYKEYLVNKYGNNNKYLEMDKVIGTEKYTMISKSSFILTRSHFMDMCDFLFKFLDFIDKKYKLNYDDKLYNQWICEKYVTKIKGDLPFDLKESDKKRLLAFMFERMSSIYSK